MKTLIYPIKFILVIRKNYLVPLMFFFIIKLHAQIAFYDVPGRTGLTLLESTNKYFIFHRADNSYLYKMNYQKEIIDSTYFNYFVRFARFLNNDTIVMISPNNYTADSLSLILLDTNLNIINKFCFKITTKEHYIISYVLLKRCIIVLLLTYEPNQALFLTSIGYDGTILNTEQLPSGCKPGYLRKLSDTTFFFFHRYLGGYIKNDSLQTLYQISYNNLPQYTQGTIVHLSACNNGYSTDFNDKFTITNNLYKFQEQNPFIGVWQLNTTGDTILNFTYFNVTNSYLPVACDISANNNHLYVASLLDLILPPEVDTTKACVSLLDSNLNIKWHKIFAFDVFNYIFKLLPAPNNGCLISLCSSEYFGSYDVDCMIIWLDTLGNEVVKILSNDYSNKPIAHIYPNPGTDLFYIEFKNIQQPFLFELYDIFGKIKKQAIVNTSPVAIRASDLCSGLYFYRIIQNGQVISQGKWIKL